MLSLQVSYLFTNGLNKCLRKVNVIIPDGMDMHIPFILCDSLITSIVCGWTPSSTATTSTIRSVNFAPRDLSTEKASWPGVSKNVTGCLSSNTTHQSINNSSMVYTALPENAPMC